jgi:RimJ/RimL family protein N-acetyltransferase
MTIETPRLRLHPFAPSDLIALIDGKGIPPGRQLEAAPGLTDFYAGGGFSPIWLDRLRVATEPDPWWFGFAVALRPGATVIGMAGFKGPADSDGVVEIGYGIVPGHQGRGFATEAARALLGFAFGEARVHRVRAHTLPTVNASTRVLEKCGFTQVGPVVDPEDGPVWRWERPRDAGAPS